MLAVIFAALAAYDVLISAGHEGRPASCAHFPQHHCNLGAAGERDWTPIVADAATRVLRSHGISVMRLPADFAGTYDVSDALFIHFDGAAPPCVSGASIGYHDKRDRDAAAAWRGTYAARFPFTFRPDNFTKNLRDYYAFSQVRARDASLVLELGEISCPAQRTWLSARLDWIGALIAYFMGQRIGKGNIPLPIAP